MKKGIHLTATIAIAAGAQHRKLVMSIIAVFLNSDQFQRWPDGNINVRHTQFTEKQMKSFVIVKKCTQSGCRCYVCPDDDPVYANGYDKAQPIDIDKYHIQHRFRNRQIKRQTHTIWEFCRVEDDLDEVK